MKVDMKVLADSYDVDEITRLIRDYGKAISFKWKKSKVKLNSKIKKAVKNIPPEQLHSLCVNNLSFLRLAIHSGVIHAERNMNTDWISDALIHAIKSGVFEKSLSKGIIRSNYTHQDNEDADWVFDYIKSFGSALPNTVLLKILDETNAVISNQHYNFSTDVEAEHFIQSISQDASSSINININGVEIKKMMPARLIDLNPDFIYKSNVFNYTKDLDERLLDVLIERINAINLNSNEGYVFLHCNENVVVDIDCPQSIDIFSLIVCKLNRDFGFSHAEKFVKNAHFTHEGNSLEMIKKVSSSFPSPCYDVIENLDEVMREFHCYANLLAGCGLRHESSMPFYTSDQWKDFAKALVSLPVFDHHYSSWMNHADALNDLFNMTSSIRNAQKLIEQSTTNFSVNQKIRSFIKRSDEMSDWLLRHKHIELDRLESNDTLNPL